MKCATLLVSQVLSKVITLCFQEIETIKNVQVSFPTPNCNVNVSLCKRLRHNHQAALELNQ